VLKTVIDGKVFSMGADDKPGREERRRSARSVLDHPVSVKVFARDNPASLPVEAIITDYSIYGVQLRIRGQDVSVGQRLVVRASEREYVPELDQVAEIIWIKRDDYGAILGCEFISSGGIGFPG